MGRTLSGLRSAGSTLSARIAAPMGSVPAPVNATTPFISAITPGVAIPCSASSAAITENAVPMRTVRPSRRRAPTIVIVPAAAVRAREVMPTPAKWTMPSMETMSPANMCSRSGGTAAANAASASTGASLSLHWRICHLSAGATA